MPDLSPEPHWPAIRDLFPALQSWTYLNTATYGQLPRTAVEAMQRHFAHRDELACADFLDWFTDMDRLRARIGQLISCQADDIAFVPNAAAGLSLLLHGMTWEPGDEVLTLEHEFPNNLYYPSLLAGHGVTLREIPWSGLRESVTARTRLVVLSTVNYLSGLRPDLDGLGAWLRSRGVLLYVDGTQSLGALQFDVRAVAPDLFAVHGYKWLLSPTGAAFLYIRPDLRARLEPQVVGWRSDRNWRRVQSLHHGAPEFTEAAERYEGGMIPFTILYGMAASVELMLQLGPESIESRVLALADQTAAVLRERGARLLRDESPHYVSPIIAARFEGRDAPTLAAELKDKRILVSARHGNLRVSTHFYNNEEDIARLGEAVG